MFKKFSTVLQKISTGWMVLLCSLIFFGFMFFVLPAQSEQSERDNPGLNSPDMSFFYSRNDLYQMAESYGPTGRGAYIRSRFTFDLIFPLVYGLFLITSTGWLSKRLFSEESLFQNLNLIPLFGMFFDYLENISASIVMARYPQNTILIDFLTPIFSVIKWIFVSTAMLLPFILLIAFLIKSFRGRNEIR